MSSSLHKMQAAWLPNAQRARPRLITRHAVNSLFDFIDVLKIYGGRRSSEAEIRQQRSFQPRGLSVFILPAPGPGGMGIAIVMCLPGTKAALGLQRQNFCLSLLPAELRATAAEQDLCCGTCSASPSIAANHPAPSSSLSFPREQTAMVAQGEQKGRSRT